MSSKKDSSPLRRWRAKLKGLPIAVRLTCLYAVASAIILIAICATTYLSVATKLETRNNDYITDELNVLHAMLQEPNGMEALRHESKLEQAERTHVVHYVRIQDLRGRSIFESTQMDLLLPAAVFPAPTSTAKQFQDSIKWQAKDGNVYRLRSIRTGIEGLADESYVVQIAMDITSLEAFLATFKKRLAAILLFGVALSAVAGWMVARRGLRPLGQITATAERITACSLDERIDPGQWPRELATLAKAFDRMLDRLEEAFDGLSQYTGNLAHELRTPIYNLMIEADIALMRERSPEEYQKVIGSSMEEYERLSRLVDSLLFLARADHAAHALEFETVDVAKRIEDITEFFRALGADREVKVSCHGEGTLSADPVLFRRALSNLVSNALKYTAPGGEVVICARQRDDMSLEIDVADTGCGIDPEHLPRIFDRFYRGGDDRRRGTQGYGLGLSIVKAIMELHGGSARAESEPGRGTTFTLSFPPSKAESKTSET